MKKFLSIFLILTVAFYAAFAQESSLADPDASTIGADSAEQALKEVSVEIVVVNVDLETALRQNELRAGTRSYVPESVIRNMKGSFTMPTFEEGFDKIYVYNPYKEGAKYTIFEKE